MHRYRSTYGGTTGARPGPFEEVTCFYAYCASGASTGLYNAASAVRIEVHRRKNPLSAFLRHGERLAS